MSSIVQLLFPSTCLLCNAAGSDLCARCEAKIERNRRTLSVADTPIWAGAVYGDELSELILMAKEQHIAPARNFLAGLLVDSFMRAQSDLEESRQVILVPVPSSKSANRVRGYRHAYLLAVALVKRLPQPQRNLVTVQERLVVNRKIADQTNLNRSEREHNVHGAYSVADLNRSMDQAALFLVDDVVTTGSSVREGVRTLRQAGVRPLGVLAAGVSPRLFS